MTACKAIIFKLTEQKIYYARSLGEFVEFYLFIYGCSRAHTTINCATALPLAWHRAARSKQGPANDPLDAFLLLPTLLQFILFFFAAYAIILTLVYSLAGKFNSYSGSTEGCSNFHFSSGVPRRSIPNGGDGVEKIN